MTGMARGLGGFPERISIKALKEQPCTEELFRDRESTRYGRGASEELVASAGKNYRRLHLVPEAEEVP